MAKFVWLIINDDNSVEHILSAKWKVDTFFAAKIKQGFKVRDVDPTYLSIEKDLKNGESVFYTAAKRIIS